MAIDQDSTTTGVVASANPSVSGQAVTFTATVTWSARPAAAYPTGTVTFYDNGTSIGTGTLSVVSGHDQATLTTSTLSTASHPITAAYTSGDGNFNASPVSAAISQVVNKDSTTTTASASPSSANVGQTVTFTATVTANAPGSGTPTGTVDFFDTTTNTDLTPGGVALSSGTATFATTSLAAGSHTIKATYSGDGNFLTSSGTRRHGHDRPVDHRPRSLGRRGAEPFGQREHQHLRAASTSIPARRRPCRPAATPSIKASVIDVHGGVQKSGSPAFSPAPVTGAAVVADPLASLPLPSTSGLTNYGCRESCAGTPPRRSSRASISRSAFREAPRLTMNSGTTSSRGAASRSPATRSVTGSGVTIVNAGSNYPSDGRDLRQHQL